MRHSLTFTIDASQQKAVALRDKLAAVLGEDDDVGLISSSQAQALESFEVVGVDMTTGESFRETVEAVSREEATGMVATADRVVAAARAAGSGDEFLQDDRLTDAGPVGVDSAGV